MMDAACPTNVKTPHRSARIAQCGNYKIFPSLRFYVKSKLANLKYQNLSFLHIERQWILTFFIFALFGGWYLFTKLTKFRVPKMVEMVFLELLDSSKLISRKIWITKKWWNFHTVNCRFVPETLVWKQKI